ncbi:MAG TPA: molybdopterin dinucleotide binding domain-containing protein, partial [Candidatus Brocadiales bacterium]|nr:molybdopterin dinucleotide binding domain-containing protein [Candidatus Brocadiales bacterium]
FVEIHPDDALKLKIETGQIINVISRRGEVQAKAVVTKRSLPGTVFMTFHYPDVLTNKLTGPGEDMLALTPEYKVCAVKIER